MNRLKIIAAVVLFFGVVVTAAAQIGPLPGMAILPVGPPPKLDVNKIPLMTGATTNGVTMSASSQFNVGFAAWKAADQNTGTDWETNGTVSGTITVDFGSPIYTYSYTIFSNSIIHPVAWTYEGSNTCAYAGEQVVLDTRAAQAQQNSVTVYTLANGALYRCYRLNVSSNGGSVDMGIFELQIRQ